ncbi:MAG TPA: hypothetical protein VHM92_11095 [Allosphingosinicella sp.]|nr:hypothetical protein [Allosphingosinicella sp.]
MTLAPEARTAPPSASPGLVPGRSCGSCTLCCKTVAVEELAKPSGSWCAHCRPSQGCSIYESRPAGCRDFHCEWLRSERLGPEWRPDRAKFALMVTPTGHLAACVDPGFPTAWRQPAYYPALRRWACERADNPASSWPGVDVWIGRRCILILPDGETDLGIVAADEEVRIERRVTAAGQAYVATKFAVRTPLQPH